MKWRGYLTVTLVGLLFLPLDLLQRTVVHALVVLRPSRREAILARWQRWIAHTLLALVEHVGGADIGDLPRIPGRSDVLVVMNHQSLLDIPIVVASLDRLYPRIVTRARYASGKPVISHMVRLYQYPVVDPSATTRAHVTGIVEAAATGSTPLAIFPEGTRTRDGDIGRFRRLGLETIFKQKRWTVYPMVVDGLWQAAKLDDFVDSVQTIRARVRCGEPLESPDIADGDHAGFIRDLRDQMVSMLEELRAEEERRDAPLEEPDP